MPVETPVAPATNAPASDTPPPAAPATQPAQNQAPAPSGPSKLASQLMKVLTGGDGEPAADKPQAKPEPVAEKKPEPEKPITVRKKAEKPAPVEAPPPIPKKSDLKPAPTEPAVAKPEPVKKDDDADFEKDLLDDERTLLEDAREAEKRLGPKYAGQGAKMTAFLKEAAKKSEAAQKGDIDADDYRDWYAKNLPKIGAKDFRELERARIREDVAKDFEPKLMEEKHARWAESEAPKIKAKGDALYAQLVQAALPEEMAKAIKDRTDGINPATDRAKYIEAVNSVAQDFRLEHEITESVVQAATADLEEFQRLTTVNPATRKALVEFNPNNPQHDRVLKIVSDVCEKFKQSGDPGIRRDGKWFVTREEWTNMDPSQRGQFWTFSNDELIQRAMGNVKNVVAQAVTTQRERLEKHYGFKRSAPVAPAAPANTPPPQGSPPAPRPSMPPVNGGQQLTPAQRLMAQLNSSSE